MEPAIPRVLAQSLPAPRLLVSLWDDSFTSSPGWTSSLEQQNQQNLLELVLRPVGFYPPDSSTCCICRFESPKLPQPAC